MPHRLPQVHVVHLITELRRSSAEHELQGPAFDDGLPLGLAVSLMRDAADALEALLSERTANPQRYPKTPAGEDRRR